jgi:hypothetical protein
VQQKESDPVEPKFAFGRDDPDELRASRIVLMWVALAVLVILCLALAVGLARRDINRTPPDLEDEVSLRRDGDPIARLTAAERIRRAGQGRG